MLGREHFPEIRTIQPGFEACQDVLNIGVGESAIGGFVEDEVESEALIGINCRQRIGRNDFLVDAHHATYAIARCLMRDRKLIDLVGRLVHGLRGVCAN